MGLESGPATDLALEPIRPDHDRRTHIERVGHVLAPGSHDVTILPEQSDCTGLDPDLGPRFRGFLREVAVEEGPLKDISALVPGPGLVDDQRASVGRDHAGAVDLMADEFLRRREADFLDRKSTRLNSSHTVISYAVFCLKKKKTITKPKSDR